MESGYIGANSSHGGISSYKGLAARVWEASAIHTFSKSELRKLRCEVTRVAKQLPSGKEDLWVSSGAKDLGVAVGAMALRLGNTAEGGEWYNLMTKLRDTFGIGGGINGIRRC